MPHVKTGSGGGGGDTSGPGAAVTDNAIVRWHTTSGTDVQNSAVTIADTTGSTTWPAAAVLEWTGRSKIASAADGYISLTDNAGTAFTGLRLGGTTSSYPMVKRNSAGIDFRLADDSADCAITCAGITASGTIAVSNANGGAIVNVATSASVPTLLPDKATTGTGIALSAANTGCLVAGGAACLTWVSSVTRSLNTFEAQAALTQRSPSGAASTEINSAHQLLSALSGATVTASSLIPAGTLVFGITTRVTTLITGATSFDIGDGTDQDKWGATIAVAAGTTTTAANFTTTTPTYYAAATNVVLTANGSNFTAGTVRIIVHYLRLNAPSS